MKIAITSFLVLVLFLLGFGASYQNFSEKKDRGSIPGDLVDINGSEIHIFCLGEGSPTVILENGTWGSYPDWMEVMEGVKSTARVCSYDRLGIGWSSLGEKPSESESIAKTLKTVLEKRKIDGKIILVGFSAGGIYARKYAELFPGDVTGLVLVDSAHEEQVSRNAYRPNDTTLVRLCSYIAWTGIARIMGLMDGDVPESFEPEIAIAQKNIYYRSQFCSGLLEQSDGFPREFTGEKPRSLGNLPLVVIASKRTLREQGFGDMFSNEFLDSHELEWPLLQKELVSISSNSEFLVAQNSGHSIALEQPEIIVESILKLVNESRLANK